MYCKIIEEVCREPLGGVEIFQGSVENPLRVSGTGESRFQILKEYCEKFLAGSA
jgi:hypothetical protein